jgi:3-methyladenine DNA glycosylase/8-oxoguanine DNA glycosylase
MTVARRTAEQPHIDVTIAIAEPLDLRRTLSLHRRGTGDPALRIEARRAWRATRTADGPATVYLERTREGVLARGWGPGAQTSLEALPALLGADDDPTVLSDAPSRLIRELARRLPDLRIGRTGNVWEALWPAIVEQKVTGDQARRGYRGLVGAYGEPAPGPFRLRLPPAPEVIARLPYHAFHPYGIERRRADTLRRAAREATRLDALSSGTSEALSQRLRSIPGIGIWTAAEVTARALGDPDAVSVGDFHLPDLVCWALAGEPRGSDERMLELLEPYRGQRGRLIRLLEAAGPRPPAYGPRLAVRRIERD